MIGSIAKDPGAADSDSPSGSRAAAGVLERLDARWIGLAFVAVAIAVYVFSNPERQNFYNHFVWQAAAWLDGRVAITYPFDDGRVNNVYFQDVYPLPDQPGRALLPFPPLPAVALLPLVALFGLATNAALVAAVVGGLNAGLCWRMLTRVTASRGAAFLGTTFYGFGSVAWYAAMLGSTWFLAHVVASTFLFLAITAALDAERAGFAGTRNGRAAVVRLVDRRQFVAGLLFGTAALSRLTTIFGAPFFVFVGGGGRWLRRAFSVGLGAVIPVAILLAYNVATTGHFFNPAYEYLYRNEYRPDSSLYHPEWAIEDPRYIPQNAGVMLAWPPDSPLTQSVQCDGDPATGGSLPEYQRPSGLGILFDEHCPILRPDPIGMSLLLASPAYLLAIPALWSLSRRRLVAGALLAAGAIALINLMHFSQGWVQFGYRFSNDFAPFAMVPVALGIARLGVRPLSVLAVVASIVINAWGVYWGVTLGW